MKLYIMLFRSEITYAVYIDYYMASFISYPLPALGHDISQTADRLKG